MVNINLVCQSVPKEPLQARVSKGAVATAITACGFVTTATQIAKDYGKSAVATAITACGFVTDSFSTLTNIVRVATAITACGFVTMLLMTGRQVAKSLQQRLPLAVL